MNKSEDVLLPAFKFIACNTENICRLCLDLIDQESVSMDDIISLQKPYIEENTTLADMFITLDVSTY